MGIVFREYVNIVKFHEMKNHFEVVGVTSNMTYCTEMYGIKVLKKTELKEIDFDVVIIMTEKKVFKEILRDVLELGIKEENILSYKVLSLPDFDMERYIDLKKNVPSILSNNCWGGLTYHNLGLEFTSPTINMYIVSPDYLKLLKNPYKYMNEELKFEGIGYSALLKREYPILKCADINLHFNHYDTFEKANEDWEKRKKRINWNNLFVMMYTKNYDEAREFASLPYKKKVCFVPFETTEESMLYVDFCNKEQFERKKFSQIINGMANGIYPYYDVLELLNSGKVKKICPR